jgi:hypothetical protein
MPNFVGSAVTAGPSKAIHAGLNTVIATYTLNETASGSTSIAIYALPGGARVYDAKIKINHAALTLGAAPGIVAVSAQGRSLVGTATPSTSFISGVGSGLGQRMTSSANVTVNLGDVGGSGTASTIFTVILSYTVEDDGD